MVLQVQRPCVARRVPLRAAHRPLRGRAFLAACAAWAVLAAAAPVAEGAVDCFADRIVSFTSGFADPTTAFRYGEIPGIVLGPPGDSLPVAGTVTTLSLGWGGSVTLALDDAVIVDGPGPDFIVFENAFFKSFVPTDPNGPCTVFAEPGSVEVSADGVAWTAFPYDPGALPLVGQDQTDCADLPSLSGLAGLTPTFTGNWTIPDDPLTWDPAGTGGVSGAGGDAFDLADVGLAQARYIRITDLDLGTGFSGPAEGFDLDAVVALHAVPLPPWGPDSDGDALSDADEVNLHGSDPNAADSDGDGIDDGAEVAACRDPMGPGTSPAFVWSADLHFPSGATDELRWSYPGGNPSFDLIRGDLGGVDPLSDPVNLGSAACVEENSFNLTSADHPDGAEPAPGEAFYYLLRMTSGGYGLASDGRTRQPSAGDCTP